MIVKTLCGALWLVRRGSAQSFGKTRLYAVIAAKGGCKMKETKNIIQQLTPIKKAEPKKDEVTDAVDSDKDDSDKDDSIKDACSDKPTMDSVIKAVLDSNKAVLDAVTKLTEALTSKTVTKDSATDPTVESTITTDGAIVADSDANNSSTAIDDFMQLMRS